MAFYEFIFIVRADLTTEQVEQVAKRVEDYISASGSRIARTELWGRRALAYNVKKANKGFYIFHVLEGGGSAVNEIEARMRIDEDVLKFQTVRVEELPTEASALFRAQESGEREGTEGAPRRDNAGDEADDEGEGE
ncbi:MAG: 30S ribosomal protein S6 [Magnetococcus sp. WYHC-3]